MRWRGQSLWCAGQHGQPYGLRRGGRIRLQGPLGDERVGESEKHEARTRTLDDVINQTVGRILDQFGFDLNLFERWSDEQLKRHPDAARRTGSKATAPIAGGTEKIEPAAEASGRQHRQAVKKRR